jgi:hypothetical protein
LSHLLQHLSKKAYWHQIERELNARSIEIYDLSQDSHSAPPWRRSIDFPRSILSTHSHTQQCYVVA